MPDVYYLIETPVTRMWWAGGTTWTARSDEAVRFCRRQDAEKVRYSVLRHGVYTVTEHMDVPPPGSE